MAALRQYFGPVDWRRNTGYTGSAFETLDGGGDTDEVQNHFSYADCVAVTMLGVHVPARAAVVLTADEDGQLTHLLANIPSDLALEDVDGPLRDVLPACYTLDRLVDALPGLGPTKTSKLLARKRPHLLPVLDDVILNVLGRPSGVWEPLRQLLRAGLADELRALREEAGVPDRVSTIRVLDVALWMRHAPDNRKPTGHRVR